MEKQTPFEKSMKRIKKRHATYTPKPKKAQPMNPLSDFLFEKNGHRVSESEARIIKVARFSADVYDAKAIDEKGRLITLGEIWATVDNVEFIQGKWFVQRKFPHKIIQVDGTNVVLGNRIDTGKNAVVKVYGAKWVRYDNFGPTFYSQNEAPECFVAKYEMNNETIYCIGSTQQLAESRMQKKLYERYKDVIHFITGENNINIK